MGRFALLGQVPDAFIRFKIKLGYGCPEGSAITVISPPIVRGFPPKWGQWV